MVRSAALSQPVDLVVDLMVDLVVDLEADGRLLQTLALPLVAGASLILVPLVLLPEAGVRRMLVLVPPATGLTRPVQRHSGRWSHLLTSPTTSDFFYGHFSSSNFVSLDTGQ